jgi:hypothetical protein
LLVTAAAFLMSAQFAVTARAEDTTIIKKDQPADSDSTTTIVKKRDDINLLPVPHTEEHKTIIKKEHDHDED